MKSLYTVTFLALIIAVFSLMFIADVVFRSERIGVIATRLFDWLEAKVRVN